MSLIQDWILLRRFPALCRTLSEVLEMGVGLQQAVDLLVKEEPQGFYQDQLLAFQSQLNQGHSVIGCLSYLLPPSMVIEFGDSGYLPHLPEFLAGLAAYIEEKLAMASLLLSKLIYPFFLLSGLGGLSSLFVFFIGPQYDGLLDQLHAQRPGVLKVMQSVRTLCQTHGALLGLGLLCIFTIFWYLFGTQIRHWILSKFWKMGLADYLRVLALLLKSGLPLKHALDVLKPPSQSSFYGAFQSLKLEVFSSGAFVPSMARIFALSPFHQELLKHGELTGSLDKACLQISNSYREQDQAIFRRWVTVIPSLLLVLFGALVMGFLYVGMAPMTSILNQL